MGLITQLVSFCTQDFCYRTCLLILALTNGGLSGRDRLYMDFALSKFQVKPYNFFSFQVCSLLLLWAFWHTGTLFWQTVFTANFSEEFHLHQLIFFQYLLPWDGALYHIYIRFMLNGTNGNSSSAAILPPHMDNISISILVNGSTAISQMIILLIDCFGYLQFY